MMLAIAIPNFVKARETALRAVCIQNLKQIQNAKEQWALEYKTQIGDPVSQSEVDKLIGHALACPSGGTYSYGAVGTPPRCSKPGHQLPD